MKYLLNKYSTSAQDNDKIIFYELKPKNDTKLTFCESRIDFVHALSIVILKKRGLA